MHVAVYQYTLQCSYKKQNFFLIAVLGVNSSEVPLLCFDLHNKLYVRI
jgi:hypothetical protein